MYITIFKNNIVIQYECIILIFCIFCIIILLIHYRQLTAARDRIATGLKKILETNELVTSMQV